MSMIEQLRRTDSFPVSMLLRQSAADKIETLTAEVARLNRIIWEMDQAGLSRLAAEQIHPPTK